MDPRIENARKFAAHAHNGQKYGIEFPYMMHLQAAYSVAVRFHITDVDVLCAVWLHDTLEDTPTTFEELASLFGEKVARLVSLVTEPKGGNRRWRQQAVYPVIGREASARLIKLCDRISHLEAGGAKIQMYVSEHAWFKKQIFEPAMRDADIDTTEYPMWQYLDGLIIDAKRELARPAQDGPPEPMGS